MLVESLIRLGKPLITGGLSPAKILEQVTDVADPSARNFLSKVVLVEMDGVDTGEIAVQWVRMGNFVPNKNGKGEVFQPHIEHAVATPFVLPSGGNPLNPQGRYGVPAYPLYEKHFQGIKADSAQVVSFLASRVERTSSIDIGVEQLEKIGVLINGMVKEIEVANKEKWLGLLVLLPIVQSGMFRYENHGYVPVEGMEVKLGTSRLYESRCIVADLSQIVAGIWESKLAEGAEKGRLTGEEAVCTCCGTTGDVVSIYSKAWSWFTTTWPGPLSAFLKTDELVHGVALCPMCYQALTYGSNLFDSLTMPLSKWLTKELFAPVDNTSAREFRSEPAMVFGGILPLPIKEIPEEPSKDRDLYVQSLLQMTEGTAGTSDSATLHLQTLTGIERDLPELLVEGDLYRLTILYFSGDSSRGDIHLRATIEDVLPSAAQGLTDLVEDLFLDSYALQKQLFGSSHPEQSIRIYRSLPAMLSKAYGMTRLWSSLASAMHRQALPRELFVRHAALRMQELSRKVEDKFYQLRNEIFFYLYYEEFLYRYRRWLGEERGMSMKSWQEQLQLLDQRAYSDLEISGVTDLGFAAGYLVGKFSRLYFVKTEGKHFLKDRVITFGSKLNPEIIVEYGLKRMIEYVYKLKFEDSFYDEELLGLILVEYQAQKEQVSKQKDDFMTSFWAGYCLNRGKKKKEAGFKGQPEEKEEEPSIDITR